jgi:ParB/RepB/Spo0J family partition protein
MSEPVVVLTQFIHPNPYQPRQGEDPAAIAELAASIEKDGLLQIPTGRPKPDQPDQCELAFGHSRLAAYRLLESQGLPAFHEMPLIVRDLTDLQMFELGLQENIKRRNLNPIELATAMKRYMDDFHKTSEEAGELFGVSAETVRGNVRLLGLPEPVQGQLAEGEISVTTARKFLTAARVLDEEKITALSTDLSKGKFESAEQIQDEICETLRSEMYEMWGHYGHKEDQTPRGGSHLWPLTWKHNGLPLMTPGGVVTALKLSERAEDIRGMVSQLNSGMVPDEPHITDTLYGRIRLMINPPACTECPLYVKMEGEHFCGLKACWSRKKQAWITAEFNKFAAKSGVAVYDKEKDGQGVEADWNQRNHWKTRFAEKDPDLRLKPHFQDYNPDGITGSYYATVVDVNTEHVATRKAKEKADRDRWDYNSPAYKAQQARAEQLRQGNEQFLSLAVPVFAAGFSELTNIAAMESLTGPKTKPDWPKAKKLQALHEALAEDALDKELDSQQRERGPVAIAKHLAGMAKTWGVKLPKDWDERAKALMPAEEEKPTKKAKKGA